MQRWGVLPDVITYNAVISACEKGRQPEQALKVFQALQRQRTLPDIITYDAVVSAYEKGKQPSRALVMF